MSNGFIKIAFILLLFSFISFGQADKGELKLNPDLELEETEDEEFIKYEGKIIRHIIIQPIDVSGKSVDNGDDKEPDWFGRISNSLHFKTKNWAIKNMLLFEKGDRLKAIDVSNSERLLRKSDFLLDARIKVTRVYADSVDLIVITKDRWTLTPLFSYDTDAKNGYAGLRDDNFLGFGHRIKGTVTHDQNKTVGWGGVLQYTASNVAGSFIDIDGRIETNSKYDFRSLRFSRPFITTETEWAGGMLLSWEDNSLDFKEENGHSMSLPFKRNVQDFWVGRSFPFWIGDKVFRKSTRFVTSARVSRRNYSLRPEVTSDSNRVFENNFLTLFGFGIVNQRFYKDFYIDKYGTTEDVPIGGILSFTFGFEEREFNDRWYTGIEAVYSRRIEGFGYLSGSFGLSGFRNKNEWEQNVFNINIAYHSPLYKDGDWKYRLFLQNNILFGFNRFNGEQIYLDTENGLRGYSDRALHGTKKISLNFETRIYSPFSPLGFVLGGVVFTDLGLITDKDEKLSNSKLYQSYGIGLRTRNESIARTDFEIALVYNPIDPVVNADSFKVIFTATIALGIRNFGFARPSIIPFGNNDY